MNYIKDSSSLQTVLADIGNNLYIIRHSRKEKLTAVSVSIGISHPVLSQIENGKYEGLSIKLIVKLAQYYNVPAERILLGNIDTNI